MASDDGAIVERMAAAIVSLYQNVVTQVRRVALCVEHHVYTAMLLYLYEPE